MTVEEMCVKIQERIKQELLNLVVESPIYRAITFSFAEANAISVAS